MGVLADEVEPAQQLRQYVRRGERLLWTGRPDPADILSEDFNPDEADLMTHTAVRKLLQFGESIAALTKHDLLSAELVNDWLWVGGLWARVGPAARKARQKYGEERLYENFEALAERS